MVGGRGDRRSLMRGCRPRPSRRPRAPVPPRSPLGSPRQQIVVVGIRLERQGGPTGQSGDELVAGAGGILLALLGGGGFEHLGLAGGTVGPLLGALDGRLGDQRAQQSDRPDGVVVGGDDEVELVGVDVRVARAHDRDLELVRLGDGDTLAMRVDDEDGAGQALHLAHPADRRLELDHLLGQLGRFLLGHALEVAGPLARLELLEQADALLDGREVGEHAAQPTAVDERLIGASRLGQDRLLGLLLGADEQHLLAARDGLADRLESDVKALDRLGQVDDVDPVALREDVRAHLGVPAAGLMAEVDPGLEQLPHGDGRHDGRPPVGWFLRGPSLIPGDRPLSLAGTARWERSACVLRSAPADGRSRD
jgi:hypothetical protein